MFSLELEHVRFIVNKKARTEPVHLQTSGIGNQNKVQKINFLTQIIF